MDVHFVDPVGLKNVALGTINPATEDTLVLLNAKVTAVNTNGLATEATLGTRLAEATFTARTPAVLTAGGGLKVGLVDALPAGTANIGDVDVLTLPAITGTVAISSLPALVAGTAKIGGVDLDSDATIGSAVPTIAQFVAGTDGTNARALKTDAGGELQVDVLTMPAVAFSGPIDQGAPAVHANRWPVGLSDGTAFISPATEGTLATRLAEATFTARIPAALTAGGGIKVGLVDAIPAGANNIGDVDVLTLPAVTQGTSPWVVGDGGGSLTVDGTVAVSGTVTTDQANAAEADYDTGAGTVNQVMFGLALPASGGPVAGGTGSNPVRTDPTGTTTQPISGAVSQSGTWNVNNVSGTVSLPTGAATAAHQVTQNTALDLLDDLPHALGTDYTAIARGIPLMAVADTAVTVPDATQGKVGFLKMTDKRQLLVATEAGSSIAASQSGTWNLNTVTTVSAITSVNAVIPGTGATNLGKAEDAGHVTGDTGIMLLGVRNDSVAALTGANTRYSPIATDSAGRPIVAGGTTNGASESRFLIVGGIDNDFAIAGPLPLASAGQSLGSVGLVTYNIPNGTQPVSQSAATQLNAQVVGAISHDSALTTTEPILCGAYASAAAPTDVNADADSVRLWALRNGALVAASPPPVEFTGTASSQTTLTNMVSIDVSHYGGFALQLTGTWSATVQVQESLDGGTTWVAVVGNNVATANSGGSASMTANGLYWGSVRGADLLRVIVTSWTSGTVTGNLRLLASSRPPISVSSLSVAGNVAHDSADSGNPVKIGFKGRTTNPTAAADADRVDATSDDIGRQVVLLNHVRDLVVQGSEVTISTTTETSILAAGAAGVFHDLTLVLISNASAANVRVDFRDTTGGAVVFSLFCSPTYFAQQKMDFPVPWKQTTAASAWTAQLSAAVTDVKITVQAVKNV